MKRVTIFCDGSSIGNGSPGSRASGAAILEYNGKRRIVGEYLGTGTNQQAEIVAACLGLEALKVPCHVDLYSDSEYVVRSMMGRYRRKVNHEYWKRLDAAAAPHQVNWQWTPGHAGHEWQEKCDKAARKISLEGKVDQNELDEILGMEFKL